MDKNKVARKTKSRTTQELEQLLLFDTQNVEKVIKLINITFLSALPNEETLNTIISYINKLLVIPANRNNGLKVLDGVLCDCPSSFVVSNAASWINICINFSPKQQVDALNFNIISKIIGICSGIPEFDKLTIATLPKIIDMCVSTKLNTSLNNGALGCLKMCLQKYPSPCGPFKNKIESYLCKFFASALPESTLKMAGSCFHALQQIGGAGPAGFNHKNNWLNHLNKLCSTLHKLYDTFFANIKEFNSYDLENVTPFEIPKLYSTTRNISVQNGGDAYSVANILRNVVIYINQMLIEPFPAEKCVSGLLVLDVIKRGLSVDVFQQYNESLEMTQFAALLYSHQVDLLYLLRSLIACFKQNIMPCAFTITKLLMNCLERTHKDYFKNMSEYKKAVYKVLSYWIGAAGSKFHSSMHTKLVTYIITEITPIENNVTLCLNEDRTGGKNSKGKKAIQETSNSNAVVVDNSRKSLEVQEVVYLEALNTGSALLQDVVALDLRPDTFQLLFKTVAQLLITIQGGKIMHPYTKPKCQAALYRMLVCIYEQPDYCTIPLIQTGLSIFNKGQQRSVNTISDDISLICSRGLNILEKLCQPICPTLSFSNNCDLLNYKYSNSETEAKKQNISDPELDTNIDVSFNNHSVDVINQNNAIVNAPQTNSMSASSFSKLNIISVTVVKQANTNVAGNNSKKGSVTDKATPEVGVDAEIEKNTPEETTTGETEHRDIKTEDCLLDETLKLKLEEEEAMLHTSFDFKEEPISPAKSLQSDIFLDKTLKLEELGFNTPAGIKDQDQKMQTDTDEPPIKRNRSTIEDEEQAMLNSFRNVVNEY